MTNQGETKEQLLQAAAGGDSDALGELLARHRPYLKLLAKRYLGSRIEQRSSESDLIQQTCVAAIQFISSFRGDTDEKFVAWLRTILERQAYDLYREHHIAEKRSIDREERPTGRPNDQSQFIDLRTSSPSQRLLRGETAAELARVLDQIPDRQQEAVRLRYLEGLTLAEIADVMDATPFAVVGLLNRGLKEIRRQLRH